MATAAEEELTALPRAQLQARAKAAGVRANQKSATIIEQLLRHDGSVASGPDAARAAMTGRDPPVAVRGDTRARGTKGRQQQPPKEASITLADGTGRGVDELEGLFEGLYGA